MIKEFTKLLIYHLEIIFHRYHHTIFEKNLEIFGSFKTITLRNQNKTKHEKITKSCEIFRKIENYRENLNLRPKKGERCETFLNKFRTEL